MRKKLLCAALIGLSMTTATHAEERSAELENVLLRGNIMLCARNLTRGIMVKVGQHMYENGVDLHELSHLDPEIAKKEFNAIFLNASGPLAEVIYAFLRVEDEDEPELIRACVKREE